MTRVEFEYSTQTKTKPVYRSEPAGPMRILILGDFSGRTNRGLTEAGDALAERPVVSIDVDNFDDTLFRFAPRLHLPAGGADGPGMAVEFKRLEDFHPDALFERLELFSELRQRRERLLDPATFEEAAGELKRWAGEDPSPTAPAEDDSGTLERLLGQRPADLSHQGPTPAQRLDLDGIIRRIVEPHIVPGADPQQGQLVSAVDTGIGDQMRNLLHERAFQELEAAWRSLHGLVTNVETGEELKLYLLDVSKQELKADVEGAADPADSGLSRAVVDRSVRTPGGQPWSVLLGNYTFGPSAGDLALLDRLGGVASGAGGSFIAAADPAILGCELATQAGDPRSWRPDEEDAARWQALRQSRSAAWLALVLPRLLLRLPYGKAGEQIDRFEFEELAAKPDHDTFLWGNGAFGCVRLMAQAFQERGWSMEPGDYLDIDDLPAYIYDDDGERKLKPCAEVTLGERAGIEMLSRGLIPLLSYRDRNAVRVLRFQSMAEPPSGIAGPWA